ncbi:MAG: HD domain-containing protein [Desulfobacteraceae bacterium]|nr:HD domain-containing protein [Desulfobacteraceae bacterium]MCB9495231.1 HD domain-containing protein [Desulfobacteraceae bacterium]
MEKIITRFFDAANIQRWNDHVRPVELTELDKQAHKAVISYILAKMEEDARNAEIDWIKLIEGSIFEFLHRVILTDIKPMVFHKLMQEKGKELNSWVFAKLESELYETGENFKKRFELYFLDSQYAKNEKRILKAAHYLATNWEFQIIYKTCPDFYGIEKTKESIENEIEDHYDLIGVQKISLKKKSYGFLDLCGQLRLQKRWAQSPRIPKTSVLGHMLIVAFLSYIFSMKQNFCDKRKYNNFYCGFFHDLPEVLTRDIISPVKTSVPGLEEIILEYEKIQLENEIIPLLPESWHREIRYLLDNQFKNRIIDPDTGILKFIDSDKGMENFNRNEFFPVDGKMIKGFDHLAAFVETSLSIKSGIRSKHLIEGHRSLKRDYQNKVISNIDFGKLFKPFEIEDALLDV